MSDNRIIETDINKCDYNSLAATINFLYSKKHNYDFKYFIPHNDGDFSLNNCLSLTKSLRHASWAKLLSTLKSIKEYNQYEYIVYIDSDCIFNNFSQKIEHYFSNLKSLSDNNTLESNIFFLNDKPWHPNSACAGFFILKNNTTSFEIFKSWYAFDEPQNRKFNTTHSWEQTVLPYICKKYNQSITIFDDWMFEIRSDIQLLRHIGTHEKQNRLPHFKQKIKELSIYDSFTKYSNEIKINSITYNTNEVINEVYGKN